ncbi:MAG TPA: LpxL/LpxP family Kdo(2)-lipid IV(A) lauroyl/palmitoleoyl acyltransferase [Pseudomonadales bacterium]
MARQHAAPRSLAHPRYWLTWLGIALLWLSARLPQSARLAAGRALGALLYRLAHARRHITEVNIDLCFPERDADARRQLVKDVFAANAIGLLETALGWWGTDRQLQPLLRVEGLDQLKAAQAEGRGVLLLGAHFTTLDLAGRLTCFCAPLDVIYRQSKNPVMDRLILNNRAKRFQHVIERSDIRQVLRSLKDGHIVWYAPDQDYGAKYSVFAPFFGIPAASITATSRLARMNQSPVFFFSHYREADGHYRLAFTPLEAGFPADDDVVNATVVNRIIERAIRQHPEQYMWVHRRFKTRPEGEPSFYRKKHKARR